MKRPALLGIVNVTPDSFSGDGVTGGAAFARAQQLVEDGADILDIGAESTRPGASPLTAGEEWARLAPLLAALRDTSWRKNIRLSIDTRHAQTAVRALELGADILNDVGGLSDPAMLEILADHSCDIIVMHALSVPADPAILWPETTDVVQEINIWKQAVINRAETSGIASERLIFDPGLGFGKSAEQSLTLILSAEKLVASGGRWLFGHSRKSFIKLFTDAPASERDALTRSFSAMLGAAGVKYLRVHDVAGHRAMLERLCT
jgi:dihydropteroate synthase